jgi:hypothetical protein
MSLRDQLSGIYQRHGILTPDIVVNEARPADSPLHNRFEWDDSIAAEAHRRAQAQELIRSIKVVYRPADEKENSKKIREWQAVRTERGSEYKPVEEVAMDPMLRKIVLADMEREWKALHRRYSQFAEFITMVTADMNSDAA